MTTSHEIPAERFVPAYTRPSAVDLLFRRPRANLI